MRELLLMTRIADRRVAFRSAEVQSVVEIDHVVPVPCAPSHIAGLTALRSRALTVLDARKALDLAAIETAADNRAVVVDVEGHAYAVLIDRVDDVVEAMSEPVLPDATLGTHWDRVAAGVVETALGPALLVDIAALIAGPSQAAEAA